MALLFFAEYTVISVSLLFSVPILLTYLVTYFSVSKAVHSYQGRGKLPILPYWVPGFGHSVSFLWNAANLAKLTNCDPFQSTLIRLQFFNTEINFITGSNGIISVWQSKALEAKASTCFAVEYLFKTPKQAMKMYRTDDSGINPQPHPTSKIPSKDRFYYQSRKALLSFFSGPTSKNIANRFLDLLRKQISQQKIGDDWLECPDLYSFTHNLLICPALEAMCGPVLMQQNATFVEDFWKFHSDVLYFVKGCPRWLAPKAWANRDRLLASVRRWHIYSQKNFRESHIEADGHDCFWGSPLIRSRQSYLSQIDSFDADAIASQDLGLIWAENANSIPATFWLIVELARQPHVLSQAREEISASHTCSLLLGEQSFDIDSLCSKPLLQSVYAEVLRLYTSNIMLRNTVHKEFCFENWRIPVGKLVAVDSHVAHMDKNVWNTGNTSGKAEGSHPISQFWAQRFLEYPNDSTSGPLRYKRSNDVTKTADPMQDHNGASPQFAMEGLSGAWIPFGGGSRQCPGHKFAKQQIIVSFAAMASTFDIELLDDRRKNFTMPDMRYYGTGTLPPKGKTPFRIRRRHVEPMREQRKPTSYRGDDGI